MSGRSNDVVAGGSRTLFRRDPRAGESDGGWYRICPLAYYKGTGYL